MAAGCHGLSASPDCPDLTPMLRAIGANSGSKGAHGTTTASLRLEYTSPLPVRAFTKVLLVLIYSDYLDKRDQPGPSTASGAFSPNETIRQFVSGNSSASSASSASNP
ncbi:MAG: hypothetical protein Q9212_003861 [Teloschistes hypoglaucus]